MILRSSCLITALVWGFVGFFATPFKTAWAQSSASPLSVVSPVSWQQLHPNEKRALSPLATRWNELTETQRNKWRAIASQFDQLSSAEQAAMHDRMIEWAALSPMQRNQARLNFNAVYKLPKDEKKTKWNEYQALSEAQKRELSAGILSPNKTAAPSAKPANADRLVQPAVRTLPAAAIPPRPPIDKKTLLPLPVPGNDSVAKPNSASDPSSTQEALPNEPS